MTTLHDGYSVVNPLASTTLDVRKLFYPSWWLHMVGCDSWEIPTE